ncbi:MAG: holo-[acyl-carrier-protein] synthase [Thermodesulfobacteriota bacterium]|nr:holo-[acyl-carrier-protein] synthase [Thermodesulfobacteriota bacterium]
MIVGLGLDVVELDRIERVFSRFGDRFLRRVLTENERARIPKFPIAFIAARFAAKEAAAKALGTGFRQGVGFHTLEVRKLPLGKPEMFFHGPARAICEKMGVTSIHLSITHGRDVASAVVILEAL